MEERRIAKTNLLPALEILRNKEADNQNVETSNEIDWNEYKPREAGSGNILVKKQSINQQFLRANRLSHICETKKNWCQAFAGPACDKMAQPTQTPNRSLCTFYRHIPRASKALKPPTKKIRRSQTNVTWRSVGTETY